MPEDVMFRQLPVSKNSMGMPRNHSVKERECYYVPEMIVLCCLKKRILEHKVSKLCRCWLKLMRAGYYLEWKELFANMGWKATQGENIHYFKLNTNTQITILRKILNLEKCHILIKCLVILTITFAGERWTFASLKPLKFGYVSISYFFIFFILF